VKGDQKMRIALRRRGEEMSRMWSGDGGEMEESWGKGIKYRVADGLLPGKVGATTGARLPFY
jgi:hypothetical protein